MALSNRRWLGRQDRTLHLQITDTNVPDSLTLKGLEIRNSVPELSYLRSPTTSHAIPSFRSRSRSKHKKCPSMRHSPKTATPETSGESTAQASIPRPNPTPQDTRDTSRGPDALGPRQNNPMHTKRAKTTVSRKEHRRTKAASVSFENVARRGPRGRRMMGVPVHAVYCIVLRALRTSCRAQNVVYYFTIPCTLYPACWLQDRVCTFFDRLGKKSKKGKRKRYT